MTTPPQRRIVAVKDLKQGDTVNDLRRGHIVVTDVQNLPTGDVEIHYIGKRESRSGYMITLPYREVIVLE